MPPTLSTSFSPSYIALTRFRYPFSLELTSERQTLTVDMKELLAPATNLILDDDNRECPFGPSARSRGDISAEERWVHLRGSIHSASLLEQMMDIAQDVRDTMDHDSTPPPHSTPPLPTLSLQSLMDRARIASLQLRRVQLEHEATEAQKSERPSEISQDFDKLSPSAQQQQLMMVNFSWDSFLKPGCYSSESPSNDEEYQYIGHDRRRGIHSESDSGSNTTLGSPSSVSPHHIQSQNIHTHLSQRYAAADAKHRPLGRNEMKRYGLLPLEDDRNLRQCHFCKRVLLEPVFAIHAVQCKESMRRTMEGAYEPNAQRASPSPNNDNTRHLTAISNTMIPQAHPQAISRAASNDGIPTQPQRGPSVTRSNSSSPIPTSIAQTSNSTPKTGFGPHPSSVSRPSPSPASPLPSSVLNPTPKPSISSTTPIISGSTSSASRNGPTSAPIQVVSPAPMSTSPEPVTPTKSPTTPRSINSMNKSGGIVLVGSPRAGLKSSVGQSSLLSTSGALQYAHHPQHTTSHAPHPTYGHQQYVYQTHTHSGPGPSPAPTATAYIMSPPQTPQGGFKRAFNSVSSQQRSGEVHEGMDEATLRGSSHGKRAHGAPHHSTTKRS